MTIAVASLPGFPLRRVLARTIAILSRNLRAYTLVSLLITVPFVLLLWTALHLTDAAGDDSGLKAYYVEFGMGVLFLPGWVVLQAALIHVALADITKTRLSVKAALAAAVAVFGPLMQIALIYFFGVVLGLFLIIPGVVLWVRWSMAAPACIFEQTDVLNSLARSHVIVSGYYWKLLGFYVAFFLASQIFAALVVNVAYVVHPVAFFSPYFSIDRLVEFIAVLFLYVLVGMVAAANTTAIYVELRTAREGASPGAIELFD
jgi:hypothetical protein